MKQKEISLPISVLNFFLGVIGILTLTAITPGFAAAEEQIVVDASKVLHRGLANGARLGINVNHLWDDQANRNPDSPDLATVLGNMKVSYLRYPDGEDADVHLWSTPPFSGPDPRPARISPKDWPSNQKTYWEPPGSIKGTWSHPIYDFDEFMRDCLKIECEPVIVVAYDGIYKPATPGGTSLSLETALQTAVAWVRYANKIKNYNVKYWEIGNESWINSYAGQDPGREKQAHDFILFSRAMKEVDPSIKTGISANSKKDFKTLLSIAGEQIDFLAVHSYPAQGIIKNYNRYSNVSLNPIPIVDAAHRALQEFRSHKDRIKIMMTETGGQVSPGKNGRWEKADLGHSLMTVEILGKLLQDPRIEFSIFWNTRWNPSKKNNEDDALHFNENRYTAQAWAIHILGNYVLDKMISSKGKILSFASHDPSSGKLNVLLLNKKEEPVEIKILFKNDQPANEATISVFTGKDSSDLEPTIQSRGTQELKDGQLAYKLEPVSITIVELGERPLPGD